MINWRIARAFARVLTCNIEVRGVAIALALLVCPHAHAQQVTQLMEYDALGRLTRVVFVGGTRDGEEVRYSYDAAGNRTEVVSSGGNVTTYEFIVVPLLGYILIPVEPSP